MNGEKGLCVFTFFDATKEQVSDYLKVIEKDFSVGYNYCYAMQDIYTKDAWFVPCEYEYNNAVFGYSSDGHWILNECETGGYHYIDREKLVDVLWEMIQENYQ